MGENNPTKDRLNNPEIQYRLGFSAGRASLQKELSGMTVGIAEILDALERHAMTKESALVEINFILIGGKNG